MRWDGGTLLATKIGVCQEATTTQMKEHATINTGKKIRLEKNARYIKQQWKSFSEIVISKGMFSF